MKKYTFSLAVVMVAALSAAATENVGYSGKTATGYKDIAASCNPASAQIDLDINNVRTTLLNGGDLWWDLNDARYEIPKIDPPGSAPSIHALFAGAIWIGGIDDANQLRVAAQTYRQNGNDFWPGPLDATATIESGTCNEYNRFWKVLGSDIDDLIAYREANGTPIPEAQIPASILEWPGKGSSRVQSALGTTLVINDEMAPFFDYDGDLLYDPTQGDYPILNGDCGNGYADQMIFWVYNDRGNIHTETGGQPIGIQVNALAFAFATSDQVNDMTFYRYKLINRASININQCYMAQWVDADLGCFLNDYVGCDTVRDLGICYNGAAVDADCATRGYGVDPPLVGTDFFEGPLSDVDISTGLRKQLGMAAFTYYNNDQTVTGNPETAVHYYNYMTSKWKDNTPYTDDKCSGYGGSHPAQFMFPSNPPLSPHPDYWSECACNNTAADRRYLQSSGPFTLEPGAVNNITVGAVWVRPSGVYPCPDFNSTIGVASDKAQALFDNCFDLVDGPDAPDLVIRELDKQIIISLFNPPSSNNVSESYNERDPVNIPAGYADSTYKFQGYILYQLKNAQVSVQDLNDVNSARIVAQVDIQDDVDKLINFTFDASLGADVPELKVSGTNQGIRRTFSITEDLFATGSKTLVNHKTYYYMAIAYAHNNYEQYDALRPLDGGQKTPYLQGRRNVTVYSAIPHMWESARGGTDLNAQYGDGVKITRLDGKGNGGLNLELTQESIDNIMNSPNHFYGPVEYKEGRGPIDVKVYDPMKLKDANFIFTMLADSLFNPVVIRRDTDSLSYISSQATWQLEIFPMEPGDPGLTITSDRDIEEANEQLIEEYGISIRLNQVGLPGKAWDESPNRPQVINGYLPANGFIEATIHFNDAEERWLTGVQDVGQTFSATNWIRSGRYAEPVPDPNAPAPNYLEGFFDDHHKVVDTGAINNRQDVYLFYDPNGIYSNVLDGTWAPYGLAANWVNKTIFDDDKWPTMYTFGPAFPWKNRRTFAPAGVFEITENCLHNLNGVDLVLTSDKSKWTRCVVVEVGEDPTLTEGGARKGQIRQHISWDKNGNYISSDTGRSWFPGYAINVETGERLNLLFGEDSWLVGENGRDMIWNPTSNVTSPVIGAEPLFGGKHYIYVTNTKYDEGAEFQRVMLDSFNLYRCYSGCASSNPFEETYLNTSVYSHIMWVSMATLAQGYKFTSLDAGFIPTETKVRLRVNVPYGRFTADGSNGGVPKYAFSTEGMGAQTQVVEVAKDACDLIRVVPNPYYAYSAYETSQLDNRVKITNLPDNCTITIYTTNGTLIRKFTRAVGGDISEGAPTDALNIDNTLDWDLKNNKNIPVASGLYLIHIKADGVCEKVVKWFGVLRPIDLDTF